jgi:hypothetical protein
MATLQMKTMVSDKWCCIGQFPSADAARAHASILRGLLRGVEFQIVT